MPSRSSMGNEVLKKKRESFKMSKYVGSSHQSTQNTGLEPVSDSKSIGCSEELVAAIKEIGSFNKSVECGTIQNVLKLTYKFYNRKATANFMFMLNILHFKHFHAGLGLHPDSKKHPWKN